MTNAACESLDRMREESKKATLKLVDMECSYLTVDFFRKLPQDVEKGGNPSHSIFDRYNDSYLRRIGKSFKIKICLNKFFFHFPGILMLIITLLYINRNNSFVLRQYGLCKSSKLYSQVRRLLSSPRGETELTRPFLHRLG